VDDAPPHTVSVEGQVDEAELFFTQIRMTSLISTVPGSHKLTVRDTFSTSAIRPRRCRCSITGTSARPSWRPALGSWPVEVVCPKDAWAAEGIGHFDVYPSPPPAGRAGVSLSVAGEGTEGRTLALLRNRAGDKGVALRFSTRQLPYFTL